MTPFQVVVHGPGEPPQTVDVSRSPWVIGRARESALCLARPGVFDRHLILSIEPGEGLVAEVAPGALATVRGEEFRRHRIRNGDVVRLGTVSLAFALGPPRRRSLTIWGPVFWVVLAAVILIQAYILVRLAP